MKRILSAISFALVFTFSSTSSATVIFDIYDVVDDINRGYIEFSSGGELSNISDVIDFNYTSKQGGISFDEADIVQLNVFIDVVNGGICWGDWAVGLASIDPGMECGRQTDPFTFAPYGMEAFNTPIEWLGFWGGGKKVFANRASDAGDDDEDLYFVIRPVPETTSIVLLIAGLFGLRLVRGGNR